MGMMSLGWDACDWPWACIRRNENMCELLSIPLCSNQIGWRTSLSQTVRPWFFFHSATGTFFTEMLIVCYQLRAEGHDDNFGDTSLIRNRIIWISRKIEKCWPRLRIITSSVSTPLVLAVEYVQRHVNLELCLVMLLHEAVFVWKSFTTCTYLCSNLMSWVNICGL
jgi:hypothetical protein